MELRELIHTLAWGHEEVYCKICTVERVDKAARTIDCQPLDDEDAPILGVNLQANQQSEHGVVVFPKQDSFVVVAFLSPAVAVMVLADEIESIEAVIDDNKMTIDADGARLGIGNAFAEMDADTVTIKVGGTTAELTDEAATFNGGDLGGMVIAGKATDKLNAIEEDINELKTVFSSWVTVPQDGGAALKAAVSAWAGQQLITTQEAEISNDKVKH